MAEGYTLKALVDMYRAECVLPDSGALRALTDANITPHIDEIVRDMFELRKEADRYFQAEIARGAILAADAGTNAKPVNYPVSFCLEITRHMLSLMSREPAPVHMTGLKAMHDFVRAGGPVKRVWGALRGGYFQNAIQVGTFYLDVANDTVNVNKPKVEMLPMASANFNNITSYFEFARVGEIYWKARILPNIWFPNLAPFLPAIVFKPDGTMRLEARTSYMFPMNLVKGLTPAHDFVRHEAAGTEELETYTQRVRDYAATDPRCADPKAPLWFQADGREAFARRYEEVRHYDKARLIDEVNLMLGPTTLFINSATRPS
ncbi:MAG: hypothetical protein Q7T44_12845 [Parvibaculum sp.]|nr:hypothetical protein [Parvibaculum sp.]